MSMMLLLWYSSRKVMMVHWRRLILLRRLRIRLLLHHGRRQRRRCNKLMIPRAVWRLLNGQQLLLRIPPQLLQRRHRVLSTERSADIYIVGPMVVVCRCRRMVLVCRRRIHHRRRSTQCSSGGGRFGKRWWTYNMCWQRQLFAPAGSVVLPMIEIHIAGSMVRVVHRRLSRSLTTYSRRRSVAGRSASATPICMSDQFPAFVQIGLCRLVGLFVATESTDMYPFTDRSV